MRHKTWDNISPLVVYGKFKCHSILSSYLIVENTLAMDKQ